MYSCVYLCICVLFHILLSLWHTYGPMYVCMYVCMYVGMYVSMYLRIYVRGCMYVCMYVCVCVCVCMYVRGADVAMRRTATSAPPTRPTHRLSRPPPIQKTRCRKPCAATQHLMLLMMGVCTRNMSSWEYINEINLLHQAGISNYIMRKMHGQTTHSFHLIFAQVITHAASPAHCSYTYI